MSGLSIGGHCGIPDNREVSDGVHLLVPFAGCPAAGCAEAARGLQLPHLQRLLARLGPAETDAGPAESLSTPHERVLARALGLEPVDGLIPLAAWQARHDAVATAEANEQGWAWITPCHLRVGRDNVVMSHPQELQLDGDDSRALLAAMQPYFAEDGIALQYQAPLRWLARAEVFRTLPTASLDRVVGRRLDDWMPRGEAGRPLRRLQQEMQMLLYTLPLNDARQRGGLPPVNSFWISGTGSLPQRIDGHTPVGLRVSAGLRDAALGEDWAAWQAAWQQLDARDCALLATDLDAGREVRLTLCGEARARSWTSQASSPWRRLVATFTRPAPAALLEAL